LDIELFRRIVGPKEVNVAFFEGVVKVLENGTQIHVTTDSSPWF
jgi:hypothetical protein